MPTGCAIVDTPYSAPQPVILRGALAKTAEMRGACVLTQRNLAPEPPSFLSNACWACVAFDFARVVASFAVVHFGR